MDRQWPTELPYYPNGISADTGLPVEFTSTEQAASIALQSHLGPTETRAYREKASGQYKAKLGPVYGVDPQDLRQAGWGVLFGAETPDWAKDELKPLIEFRQHQTNGSFKVFDGENGYKIGQSCSEWLAEQGASLRPVDPQVGVPYYLLIVGSPEEIPFEFQYLLDTHWGVGRLYFSREGDYNSYAQNLIRFESGQVNRGKTVALFATSHEADPATNLFCEKVAKQLARGSGAQKPIGAGAHIINEFFGESATKGALSKLLSGAMSCTPSLLITGSHGLAFKDEALIEGKQGAILCQEWRGWGNPPRPEEWFEAEDLPRDVCLQGLVWFLFACYGGGSPQFTDFPAIPGGKERIAPRSMLSCLPQAALRAGALAVITHVDKAWAYSFQSRGGGIQLQSFRDVFDRILAGHRIGFACDQFDYNRAALSMEFLEMLSAVSYGKRVDSSLLADLWVARNDSRNYIVLGDPAVGLIDRAKANI
jgi:hypothetical protein